MKAMLVCGSAIVLTVVVSLAGGAKMKITSSAFSEGGNVPSQFTCDGSDTNPPLHIEGVAGEAKSLALIVDDPDAPGGLFTHWIAWNIDPKTTEVGESSSPSGAIQGKNDFGKSGYGGPCPPSGTHRYHFKFFALDRMLELKAGAKRKELETAIHGHVIGQGELIGRYARKK